MAIHIEHVGVKNLGPLANFDKDFKNINLIYARNEHGKTFLVEFIYRSLFKVLSIGTREISSPGQVTVTGLKDRPVAFSPSTRLKLEDFWADSLPGLPRDFSKLLVVKGAELDLSSNPSGLDDAILKEFLSGEGLLDKIGKNLGKTESIAVISDGKITGAIRGDVKRYYDLGGQITKIDSLFQEINQKISGGKRYQLAHEIEALTTVINEQEKAKRNLAFLLYQQTNKLKDLRKETPDSTLAEADRLIRQFRQNQKDIEKKGLDLSVNKLKTRDYPWLDTAFIEYQNLVLQESAKKPQSGKVWLIATILSAIFAILLIVFNQPYIGIAAIVFALVFGFIYLKGQTGNISTEALKIEIEKITKEYKDRFGAPLSSGTTTMRTKLNELKPIYYSSEQLQKDIDNLNLEQNKLQQDIARLFGNLVKPVPEMDGWEKTLEELIEKNRNLDDQIRKNDIDFAALDIQPDNFIEGQAPEEFNRDKLVDSKLLLETTRENLQKSENEFQQLKQAVCGMTSADINLPWDELIEKVQAKRCDTVNQYRDVAANIMAQVNLNEVLNDLRAVESERIDQGLSSDEVQQAVKTTTGHYSLVEKDGSEIYISDQYGKYKLKDLSTGAREQVLLGLRIGFAARILAGQPLFLILDDAFQHSDWERRERLVNELYTLADMGWQIIYFTMDDHIRNLFEDRAKGLAEGNYQTILLESD